MRVILAAMILASVAHAAPVPPPKPVPPRRALAGHWRMHWAGGDYKAMFWPDGHYHEPAGGGHYEGRWSLGGDTLSVEYRFVPHDRLATDGPTCRWEATLLPGKLEGRLLSRPPLSRISFRLTPLED